MHYFDVLKYEKQCCILMVYIKYVYIKYTMVYKKQCILMVTYTCVMKKTKI